MPSFERQELVDLYEAEGSVAALGRRLGHSPENMRYWLKKFEIPIRRRGFKSPKSVRRYGDEHHNWKGGTYLHADGYVCEFAPDHPSVSHRRKGNRYVFQHRLVMEALMGRFLRPDEDVHHINGVKHDNRPGNLELTTRSEHIRHHRRNAERDEGGRFAPSGSAPPGPIRAS